MKDLIKKVLGKLGCSHDWLTYHTSRKFDVDDGLPYECKHTLICKKCGKIKQIKI